MNGWLVFGLLLAGYLGLYFILRQRQAPLPGGFEFTGPLLLWRTQWGKKSIERISRAPRFWNVVADVGIWLTWIMGILVFLLLMLMLYEYVTRPQVAAANAPEFRQLIGLPGINPLIPVGYGIAALILALVIHEGSHGVMAYVSKMRVKSLGLVFFILPIGAFVEPHDEDLLKATTREKNRVFAAGPTSNIVLAVVAGVVLSTMFVGAMKPVNDGNGVVIIGVEEGEPAQLAGLQAADLVTEIGGRAVGDRRSFSEVLNQTPSGQPVEIVYFRDGVERRTTALPADRYDHLREIAPELENAPEDEGGYNSSERGKAYLGVYSLGLSGAGSLDVMRGAIEQPFGSLPAFGFYLGYPFFIFTQGIDVMADPWTDHFVVTGPLAGLPEPVFYGLATFLYWVVWLNLMLGTFNALPAGPLDGGQMFRATLSERLMRRYQVDRSQLEVERLDMGGLQLRGKDVETQAKLDRVNAGVSRATRTLGFFILGLILLPVFAPPLIELLG